MTHRVCCVQNCDFNPGDKKDRRTIFKFCEKSPYFKTWINAIGPNLKDGKKNRKNYYICEQHFDDSNLHRSPITVLKDGKEVILPRRRPALKSTSVPYIFPGYANGERNVHQSLRLIDSNNLESSSISRFSDKTNRSIINYQSPPLLCDDSSSLQHTPMERTSENVFNTTVLLKEWNARPSYQSMGSWNVMKTECGLLFMLFESTSGHCRGTVQRSLLVKNDMTIELHAHNHPVTYRLLKKVTCLQDIYFSLRKISALKMCQEESCTIGYIEHKHSRCNLCKKCQLKNKVKKKKEKNAHRSVRLIDSNNLESSSSSHFSDKTNRSIINYQSPLLLTLLCDESSSLQHTPMECTSENVFNTTVLLKEWNARPYYQSMGLWNVMKRECGLLFMLFESTSEHCSGTVQRSLLVKNDMTIELHARNHPVTYHLLEKVTCLQDIYFSLRKISALKMCQEESCTIGYIEHKLHSRSNLCKDCQLKNKRKKERERNRERRAAARKAKDKIFMKNLKQNYKRIYNQMKKYKVELKNLKVQCASQKKEILDKAIASFSPVMKKLIKRCWSNARSDDKRGMRCIKDWIVECLLLRLKSRKAYIQLRSHNILALPTIETLNKYVKDFGPIPIYGFDPALFAMLKKKEKRNTDT